MAIILNNLPIEILLQILKYCNVQDLCRMKKTCKIFYTIIDNYKIVSEIQHTLATNQIKSSIKNRSFYSLNPFEKWKISYNWKIGRYKNIKLLKNKTRLMPWLCLDKKYLWISQGEYIQSFMRKQTNVINENLPVVILNNGSNEDVVRFRIKGNYLICGLRRGVVWIWSLEGENFLLDHLNCHSSHDINDVDITKSIFVTSSSDTSYSVWPLHFGNINGLEPLQTNRIYDKILSIEISPCDQYLAVGSAGLNNILPFHIFDIERQLPAFNCRQQRLNGAGILNLHWEDENTILTCGYDTYLKKWDIRSGQMVQNWEDPHDSVVYCLASDDLYTILTGVNSYGRAVLWDQRIHNKYIQLYYACSGSSSFRSSPVYSLDFDASQLFLALDQNVTCLDFTKSHGQIKNYNFNYYR